MFNLKRKSNQILQTVKQSFEPVRDTNVIIAEIHESFDTAAEKLLMEAKEILAGSYDIEKGERLKNVGFVMAKKAVEAAYIISNKEQNRKLATLIEYYQLHYPNNKFITEEKTKEICQKYGLLCGETEYYISDVPEKNLSEIENFKLRQEDMLEFKCGWVYQDSTGYPITVSVKPKDINCRYGFYKISKWGRIQFTAKPEGTDYHYEPNSLKICASVKDFDTKNMRIEDGYKLEQNLPDPIVLQPVNGGYLVVSKWGLEGEDKELINEKMN